MIENTIMKIKENECTGCGACFNKCPVNAISMEPNQEGFLFPKVDEDKCIKCGLCLKTCPVEKPEYKNNSNPECYAAFAEDSIRLESSSGGIFALLAENIIKKGGYVCGVAYNEDFKGAQHILLKDMESLPVLFGSKYVQSEVNKIYTEVEKCLKEGEYVLFSGCPCQVAGLYNFLGNAYEKLYTIDVVCHGVPSAKALSKFIEDREVENGKIQSLSFRDKRHYGWTHSTTIEHENGAIYRRYRTESSYMKGFLELLSIRKSCGQCLFAHLPRQADITLGDFWNIGNYKACLDDKQGTSVVLLNNEHGKKLYEEIISQLKHCEKVPLEFAKKNNAQIHASALLHGRRNRFYKLLDRYNFDKAVDYGINRRFDIGYVGWWYGLNYGSALTNYALHETLVEMGKTVLMLEWPLHEKPQGPLPDTHTRRFAKRHYEMSLRSTYDELGRFNYHCESFVVYGK